MFGKTILGKTICGPTHRLFGQLFSRMPCNVHWLFVRCTWFVKSAAQPIYLSSCSKLGFFSFFAFAFIQLLYFSSSAASLNVLPAYFPAVMIVAPLSTSARHAPLALMVTSRSPWTSTKLMLSCGAMVQAGCKVTYSTRSLLLISGADLGKIFVFYRKLLLGNCFLEHRIWKIVFGKLFLENCCWKVIFGELF